MSGDQNDYTDDYATCARTYATLCIYREDLDPMAVSQELGIQPTRTQRRGERSRSGRRPPTKIGGWFLTTKDVIESRDVRRHIDWLLDQFEIRVDAVKRLRTAGCRMVVNCYWQSASGHGGPMLCPATMGRLANLGFELWFDVYFFQSEDPEESGHAMVH